MKTDWTGGEEARYLQTIAFSPIQMKRQCAGT